MVGYLVDLQNGPIAFGSGALCVQGGPLKQCGVAIPIAPTSIERGESYILLDEMFASRTFSNFRGESLMGVPALKFILYKSTQLT